MGSNAYYKCNTGYSLLGNRVRTCQSNGAWSGEDPSCQSEEHAWESKKDWRGEERGEGG